MILEKVISGGQLGADRAGLDAAKFVGIPTGGWIPKGFLTLEGPNPILGPVYGLQEYASIKYPPRTFANVRDSDATIRFAGNFKSPGELCTMKAIMKYKKFYQDVPVGLEIDHMVYILAKWIDTNKFKVINIAGNTPRSCPGVYDYTCQVLTKVFKLLKEET